MMLKAYNIFSFLPVFGALVVVILKKMEKILKRTSQIGGKKNGRLLNSPAKGQFLIILLISKTQSLKNGVK